MVTVDPNTASRADPDLTPVLVEQFPQVPAIGDVIQVNQPDDETDFAGTAEVAAICPNSGVIYLRVNWDSFH